MSDQEKGSTRAICLYDGDIYTGYTRIKGGFILLKEGRVENVYSGARLKEVTGSGEYEMIDLKKAIVIPGMLDTHMHGIGGFGVEDGRRQSILEIAERLPSFGVTSFFPTIATLPEEQTIKSIEAIRDAMAEQARSGVGGARILGTHLEGPFISEKKKGIHQADAIRTVDLGLFERFLASAEGSLQVMTVAPELKGMRQLVLRAQERGIYLAAGHSNATYDQMVEGIEAGILHATHFFNAMRSMHHRDPGVVGAILIHPEISCELIADGIHVHPAILQFLVKEKPPGKIVLVTDCLKPTGEEGDGPFIVKGDHVKLENGVFCRIEDGTIAGSALTMDRALRNMLSYGLDLSEAVPMASLNPARVYDLDHEYGSLLPGRRADLTILEEGLKVRATMVGGQFVYRTDT